MPLEEYTHKGGLRLRMGYTTGSCAALAAGAAARMLLGGGELRSAALVTPKGVMVEAELHDVKIGADTASCAVRKDAGDDPDITDGMRVYATVTKTELSGVSIDGGDGVGRVTRGGLEQPVGAAAINSVPRRMIEREVTEACRDFDYESGMHVVISIPGGREAAEKTFNPSLGIVGGLSILGTSGIVEPMSNQAIIDTMAVEMRMRLAEGAASLVATPGNYGADFVRTWPVLAAFPQIKCSNHIGAALDLAGELGIAEMLLVGHAGKLIKLAGGIMDTHSRTADCRLDLLALHAALCGADRELVATVFGAVTVDDGLAVLADRSLRDGVIKSLLERIEFHLERRARGRFRVGAVLFTNSLGLLGTTRGADDILKRWEQKHG